MDPKGGPGTGAQAPRWEHTFPPSCDKKHHTLTPSNSGRAADHLGVGLSLQDTPLLPPQVSTNATTESEYFNTLSQTLKDALQ